MGTTKEKITLINAEHPQSSCAAVEAVRRMTFNGLFEDEWQPIHSRVEGNPYYGVADDPYSQCKSVQLLAIIDPTVKKDIKVAKHIVTQLCPKKIGGIVPFTYDCKDHQWGYWSRYPFQTPSEFYSGGPVHGLLILEVQGKRCLVSLREEDITEDETAEVVIGRPALKKLNVPLGFPTNVTWGLLVATFGAFASWWWGLGGLVAASTYPPPEESGMGAVVGITGIVWFFGGILVSLLGFVISGTSVVNNLRGFVKWRQLLKRLRS